LVNKIGNLKTIIGFILFIAVGVGNYMITEHKVKEHDKKIEHLEEQIKSRGNDALIMKQLDDIQKTNSELSAKIEKTNERVDKVLEILLRK
jgi:uncharacterized protein YlxW (UPF0749 family)